MAELRRLRGGLVAAVLILVSAVVGAPPGAHPVSAACTHSVLMVSGSSPAPAGDVSLLTTLEDRSGDVSCVTVVDDDVVTAVQAESFDVVVIASSVLPSTLGDRLVDAQVPVLVSEPFLFDEMAMTPRNGKELNGRTDVHITDPSHPLAGGLSGSVAVLESAAKVNYGIDGQAPGVETVANTGGTSQRMTIFGFPVGAEMTDRPAPAGRVGFFSSYGATLTAEGATLLNAAIDWLLGQGSEAISCGDVVTTDVVLEGDLLGCPGKGLVIGADDLTIDLNGHTIGGSAASVEAGDEGVNSVGYDGLVVRNGTIRDFFYGIEIISSANDVIEDIAFIDNAGSVEFVNVDDSIIRNTASTSATFHSVRVSRSDRNVIHDNTSNNSRFGVVVNGGEYNEVRNNDIDGGGRRFSDGVLIEGAAIGTRVAANSVVGSTFGITVDNASTDTMVVDNVAKSNTVDGIRVDVTAPSTTLTHNAANDNGEWGIRVLGSAIDGGGNTATGNGTGPCTGIACNVEAAPTALLVAGNTSPPLGDRDIVEIIEAAGIDVTIADDDDDLAGIDPTDYAMIFISTSVVPSKVADVFADAPVPVVIWEPYLFDDMAMSASGARESAASHRDISVIDAGHPLAAGVPEGNARVYDVARPLSYGVTPDGAEVVAHEPGKSNRSVLFAFDPGDSRVDGSPVPALRVGLFPTYQGALRLNDQGLAFIAATIDWVLAGGPPGNDDFADRFTLAGATATGDNVGATQEGDEPYLSVERSVWWEWTATIDGLVDIEITTDFDAITAAYTGDTLATLDQLAIDYAYHHRLSFVIEAGQTYQIAIGGRFDLDEEGDYEIEVVESMRPANDDFADSYEVGEGVHTGLNVGATLEPGEPRVENMWGSPDGWGYPIGEGSVWWSWTPPADGVVHVDTAGSDFSTLLALWSGDELTSLTPLRADLDSGPDGSSALGLRVHAGDTYRIAVYGLGTNRGNITLTIDLERAMVPVNDDVADAAAFDTATMTGTVVGNNNGATLEAGEPVPDYLGEVDGSIWWRWTAPADGRYVFDTAGSDSPRRPYLAIWQGAELGSLVLAEIENRDWNQGWVELAAQTDEQFLVAVYRAEDREGDVQLNVRELPAVGPDGIYAFAGALEVDDAGLPVVAFVDEEGLKLMRCNDVDCLGADETVNVVDPNAYEPIIGLALDASGYPVIAYVGSDPDITVAHCNDVDCAGGDETLSGVDDVTGYEIDSGALALDGAGNPVIVLHEVLYGGLYAFGELDLVRCNDADCANGDESAVHVDSSGTWTVDTAISVAVNDLGHPVLATLPSITVVTCDDVNCEGSTDGTLDSEPSESVSVAGRPSTIRLDADGHPIVGFSSDAAAGAIVCNDAFCAGDDETVVTVPVAPYVARDVYADVDALGHPVIAWIAGGAGDMLRVARCADATCTAPQITDVEWSGEGLDLLGMEVDPATNNVTILSRGRWTDALRVFTLS